ncbi:MAG: NADH-quinone oxidoreductase subunit C [Planctomycetota bacterium]|nr:MAG: NADH-quinone oxidoreductase subunit C [Planctomycetota bacterium]
MPQLTVAKENLVPVMQALRDGKFRFAHCSMITAVDHMPEEPRFEVVYGLYSPSCNQWLRVKTHCQEFEEEVPSVTGIWSGANWLERECFDMFGIRFQGHPDLRRLLMPEGYEHFPLRKEFPRDGIEPGRLYRQWDEGRRREGAEEESAS